MRTLFSPNPDQPRPAALALLAFLAALLIAGPTFLALSHLPDLHAHTQHAHLDHDHHHGHDHHHPTDDHDDDHAPASCSVCLQLLLAKSSHAVLIAPHQFQSFLTELPRQNLQPHPTAGIRPPAATRPRPPPASLA